MNYSADVDQSDYSISTILCNNDYYCVSAYQCHVLISCTGTIKEIQKKYWFRMMVWLVSYYEFFEKKVSNKSEEYKLLKLYILQIKSEILSVFVGTDLAEFLGEDCNVKLIQQILNPNFQQSTYSHTQNFIDQLYDFFNESRGT